MLIDSLRRLTRSVSASAADAAQHATTCTIAIGPLQVTLYKTPATAPAPVESPSCAWPCLRCGTMKDSG